MVVGKRHEIVIIIISFKGTIHLQECFIIILFFTKGTQRKYLDVAASSHTLHRIAALIQYCLL